MSGLAKACLYLRKQPFHSKPIWRALAVSALLTFTANAAFLSDYSPAHWSLINTNADGTAVFQAGDTELVVTGGNNGTGSPGLTDFITVAPASGTVQFQFSYATLDAPMFDFGGYLLGSSFVDLDSADGVAGTVSFNVAAGQ